MGNISICILLSLQHSKHISFYYVVHITQSFVDPSKNRNTQQTIVLVLLVNCKIDSNKIFRHICILWKEYTRLYVSQCCILHTLKATTSQRLHKGYGLYTFVFKSKTLRTDWGLIRSALRVAIQNVYRNGAFRIVAAETKL